MQEKLFRISAGMTTYNSERFLRAQLESISAQTCLPDEVIISDDDSSDSTLDILHQWQTEVPFQVVILKNSKNIGCNANFSRVLEHCTGDVIFIADSDDLWCPNRIETCVAQFQLNPNLGLITSNADLIDANDSFQNMRLDEYITRMHVREFWRFFYPAGNKISLWTGCTMALRKSVLHAILPVPTEMACHDVWLYLLAPLYGDVLYLNESLIRYRLHGQNYSTAPTVTQLRENPPSWRYFSTFSHTFKQHPHLIEMLRKHVLHMNKTRTTERYLRQLKSQERHFNARHLLENSFLTNLPSFFRELLPDGYLSHPQPLRSILYDLLKGLGVLKS